jgi:alkylhydroperoxidase/carboxymuconolactone decarboxylase family protein YurZ
MMGKRKFLKGILFFVLTISMIKMNAQPNKTANKDLSAQQQSLVKISALTATGNVELLKVELNKGLDFQEALMPLTFL